MAAKSVIYLSFLALLASHAEARDCSDIFKKPRGRAVKAGPVAAQVAVARSSAARSGSHDLVAADPIVQWREIIELRDGYNQNPPSNSFGPDYVTGEDFRPDKSGEYHKVILYPNGNAPIKAASPSVEKKALGDARPQLRIGQASSIAVSSRTQDPMRLGTAGRGTAVGPSRVQSAHSAAERNRVDPRVAIRFVVQKEYDESNPLSREAVEYYVKTMLGNKEFVSKAIDAYLDSQQSQAQLGHTSRVLLPGAPNGSASRSNALTGSQFDQGTLTKGSPAADPRTDVTIGPDAPTIILKNLGLERYFWFKPEGSPVTVPARIVDIHRYPSGTHYTFLIEYVAGFYEYGTRMRRVQQLRLGELQTITEAHRGMGRVEAAAKFMETLTPHEVATIKLARALSLKTFGYFDIRRDPEISSIYAKTPLEAMNVIGHLAIGEHIKERFGSVEDLLSSAEKAQEDPNMLDVFARLDPRYVMTRFGGPEASGTDFYWIITDDGQLKVIPAIHHDANLKPQLLRLAHGRRIFAGGIYRPRLDGKLDVRFNANGFQSALEEWGNLQAFQFENENVRLFVEIVFALQMGKSVANADADLVDAWKFRESYWESGYARRDSTEHFYEEFVEGMKRRARKATQRSGPTISWNQETEEPLGIDAYLKATNQRGVNSDDREAKFEWAHYVLKTHGRMPFAEIRGVWRRLSKMFHPDHDKSPRAARIMPVVNQAFKIIEDEMVAP